MSPTTQMAAAIAAGLGSDWTVEACMERCRAMLPFDELWIAKRARRIMEKPMVNYGWDDLEPARKVAQCDVCGKQRPVSLYWFMTETWACDECRGWDDEKGD